MTKFVFTALAIAAAGSSASATTGNDWLELDREINALTRSSAFQAGGINVSALLRTNISYSSDDASTGGGNDILGFEQDDIDISFMGEVGEFGWRVHADLDTGVAVLEDAYAWWQLSDYVSAQFGQFKPKVFHSNNVDPENQVMIDRSVLGSAFDFWNLGAGANGTYDMIDWMFNVHNSTDGDANRSLYILRVEYDIGNGAGDYEGAYGGGDDLHATAGVVLVEDDTVGPDGSLIGVDFAGTYDAFGFSAEFASIDDGLTLATTGDLGNYVGAAQPTLTPDSSPFSLTGSYMLNEEWEVAVRFQQLDDADDRSMITLGANWFQNGHNAKWQANITDISADTDTNEGTLFQVGLVLGSTR